VPDREDQFGDLGGEERDTRSAAERLEERDRTHPEPVERRPEAPRPTNRYAWVVGIVMLMGLGVLLLTTTLPNTGEGLEGPQPGKRLPLFAAPLATSELTGPANVCQKEPCSESAGPFPACEGRDRRVLHICDIWTRPVVLTFVVDRGADCFPQIDRVQRILPAVSGVSFAVVYFSRKDRDEVQEIVQRRGWTMPVAIDQDGIVTNLYGIGVCPTTVFAARGGRVVSTALGNLTEDQLRRRARRLVARG
jgi:hypothetical protein